MGLSWGEAQAIAKDKTQWKRDIATPLEAIRTNDGDDSTISYSHFENVLSLFTAIECGKM